MRVFAVIAAVLLLNSAAADDDLAAQVAATLEEARESGGLVGGAIGIMQDGEVLVMVADGTRIYEQEAPIDPNGPWHWGSIGKSITALMIATIVEDGLITWDTTVGEVFGDEADPVWHDVTLTQLLTHNSGMPAGPGLVSLLAPDPDTLDEVVAQREIQAFMFLGEPTRQETPTWTYSNLGYLVAAMMVERKTGKPWEVLVRERVFEPLSLNADFYAPKGDNVPWGHMSAGDFKTPKDPDLPGADLPKFMAPAGLIHMPMTDMLAYGNMRLGNGPQIVSAETLNHLHTPQPLPNASGAGANYAYGMIIAEGGAGLGGGPIWFHDGANFRWYALLFLFPESDTVIAITANDGDFVAGSQAYFPLAAKLVKILGLGETGNAAQ